MKPILKWAGGKGRMMKHLIPFFPGDIKTYFEPFFGSGAVFLNINSEKAVINDLNPELMSLYKAIKQNPEEVNKLLEEFKSRDSIEFFNKLRAMDRDGSLNKESKFFQAARTIYLNKTCYGGLYRVNLKGQFNVPYAKKINGKEILNIENNLKWSELLKTTKAEIMNGDFEKIIDLAEKGDFIFVDPPYFEWSKTANFTAYTKEGFGLKDQERLRASLIRADERGVKFVLTNSGTEQVRKFYKMFNVKRVPIVRTIARSSVKTGYFEYIVSN